MLRPFMCWVVLTLPALARADWEDGRVPEGANAFTVRRHELRLNVLGRSAVGLTDRLEAARSYLPPVVLPNLGLKYRAVETELFNLAFEVDGIGGWLPWVTGLALPLPGGGIAAAGAGGVAGSVQATEALLSFGVSPRATLTLRLGAWAAEGTLLGGAVAGGITKGGGTAVATPVATGRRSLRSHGRIGSRPGVGPPGRAALPGRWSSHRRPARRPDTGKRELDSPPGNGCTSRLACMGLRHCLFRST